MENIKGIFAGITNNKMILIILIIGVIFIFMPTDKAEEKNYDGSYEEKLANEAEELLSEIEGAGKLSLMITFEDKGEAVPVTDKAGKGENLSEKTVAVSGKLALIREEYPTVRGVVVVCRGAENEIVRENIINAVAALTGAEVHNIKVFKMEG